ncbi:hypothetical protein [Nocardia aurantiaca]|uniref:Uncharacterized protein n=1 Tax=Nocardia aurantiaca TaxID=2675850 RepID=A0A6I3KYM0_9NOCA|nr:hypothetical protein [Nocardia aurantiaca]MTE13606.1 hypothetical protein [Nocardia aurantiaca]
MSKKYLVGLPLAVFAMSPALAAVGAPARASVPTYTCNAQTWAGERLPTLTIEAKHGKSQAQGVAQTTWGGVAKFATIDCTLNK